jgi:hypothetical protein
MTHHAPIRAADPAEQLSQLHRVLSVVEEIAGLEPTHLSDAVSGDAYANALPLDQRRFHRLAEETTSWAAAGVAALIAAEEARGVPRAAAARLAKELRGSLARLENLFA